MTEPISNPRARICECGAVLKVKEVRGGPMGVIVIYHRCTCGGTNLRMGGGSDVAGRRMMPLTGQEYKDLRYLISRAETVEEAVGILDQRFDWQRNREPSDVDILLLGLVSALIESFEKHR